MSDTIKAGLLEERPPPGDQGAAFFVTYPVASRGLYVDDGNTWTLATSGSGGSNLLDTLTTTGDIVTRNSGGALARVPAGTAGRALVSNGPGVVPGYSSINATPVAWRYIYSTTTTFTDLALGGFRLNSGWFGALSQFALGHGADNNAGDPNLLFNTTLAGATGIGGVKGYIELWNHLNLNKWIQFKITGCASAGFYDVFDVVLADKQEAFVDGDAVWITQFSIFG